MLSLNKNSDFSKLDVFPLKSGGVLEKCPGSQGTQQ